MLLLHGPILSELLRSIILAMSHIVTLAKRKYLRLLLAFQPLDRLDSSMLILLHIVVPGAREFLKLLALDGLNLDKLFALFGFHSAFLSIHFMIAQLLQLILGSFCFDIVHFLLRLLKVVFEELEKLNANCFRRAANSFFGSHNAKLLMISSLLQNEECVNIGRCLAQLIGDVCIFLSNSLSRVQI